MLLVLWVIGAFLIAFSVPFMMHKTENREIEEMIKEMEAINREYERLDQEEKSLKYDLQRKYGMNLDEDPGKMIEMLSGVTDDQLEHDFSQYRNTIKEIIQAHNELRYRGERIKQMAKRNGIKW